MYFIDESSLIGPPAGNLPGIHSVDFKTFLFLNHVYARGGYNGASGAYRWFLHAISAAELQLLDVAVLRENGIYFYFPLTLTGSKIRFSNPGVCFEAAQKVCEILSPYDHR